MTFPSKTYFEIWLRFFFFWLWFSLLGSIRLIAGLTGGSSELWDNCGASEQTRQCFCGPLWVLKADMWINVNVILLFELINERDLNSVCWRSLVSFVVSSLFAAPWYFKVSFFRGFQWKRWRRLSLPSPDDETCATCGTSPTFEAHLRSNLI